MDQFRYFSVCIENAWQSVTIKPQSLLDVLYLGHFQDTFGPMQKIKTDQSRQ